MSAPRPLSSTPALFDTTVKSLTSLLPRAARALISVSGILLSDLPVANSPAQPEPSSKDYITGLDCGNSLSSGRVDLVDLQFHMRGSETARENPRSGVSEPAARKAEHFESNGVQYAVSCTFIHLPKST